MNTPRSSYGIVVVVALSLIAGGLPQAFAGSQKKKEGLKPVETILGAASQAKVVFLAGLAVTEENLNGDIPLPKKDLEKIQNLQKGDFGGRNFEEMLQDIVGILGLEGTEIEEARSRYRPGGSGMARRERRESSEEVEKIQISKKRRQEIGARMADITARLGKTGEDTTDLLSTGRGAAFSGTIGNAIPQKGTPEYTAYLAKINKLPASQYNLSNPKAPPVLADQTGKTLAAIAKHAKKVVEKPQKTQLQLKQEKEQREKDALSKDPDAPIPGEEMEEKKDLGFWGKLVDSFANPLSNAYGVTVWVGEKKRPFRQASAAIEYLSRLKGKVVNKIQFYGHGMPGEMSVGPSFVVTSDSVVKHFSEDVKPGGMIELVGCNTAGIGGSSINPAVGISHLARRLMYFSIPYMTTGFDPGMKKYLEDHWNDNLALATSHALVKAGHVDITVCGYRTFGLVAARIPVIGKYGDQRTPGPVGGSQSCYRNGKEL